MVGSAKVSAALPSFATSTVCGLSVLVLPTFVVAKLRLEGSLKSSFFTTRLP